jgi:elongator complex protein 3
LLANAELYEYWQRGEYHPYSDEELIDLIADSMARTPRYCRINRVIRDIPAPNIVAGSKRSNMRQDADREMHKRGLRCECLRCREVRGSSVNANELRLDVMKYETRFGMENFISFVTRDDKVAGFLRLSLPDLTPNPSPNDKEHERNLVRGARLGLPEIENAAMIREVHVYGPSLGLGDESEGEAQHVGVGLNLINAAQELAASAGFKKLAVISAIGTRPYYRKRGFEIDGLYMTRNLPEGSEPSGS